MGCECGFALDARLLAAAESVTPSPGAEKGRDSPVGVRSLQSGVSPGSLAPSFLPHPADDSVAIRLPRAGNQAQGPEWLANFPQQGQPGLLLSPQPIKAHRPVSTQTHALAAPTQPIRA